MNDLQLGNLSLARYDQRNTGCGVEDSYFLGLQKSETVQEEFLLQPIMKYEHEWVAIYRTKKWQNCQHHLMNFHYYYLLETVFIYNEYIECLNHNDVIMKGIMQAKDCRLPILLPWTFQTATKIDTTYNYLNFDCLEKFL